MRKKRRIPLAVGRVGRVRSATMSKIRSRDTIPEIMLRKELFAQGIRSQHLKGWRSKQGSIMTESWNLQRIALKLIPAESMPMVT